MDSGKTFESIPDDLFLEIFSRLSSMSIGRYRCVSKLMASILCRQDFTELFLTKSSSRPRLLFAVEQSNNEFFFYSAPQSQNPSLVVDFHMRFQAGINQFRWSYESGLIYVPVPYLWLPMKSVCVICNPITGGYVSLPELDRYKTSRSLLGFDPIDKQYKVFLMMKNHGEWVYHILTLGTENFKWRKIQCPLTHEPRCKAICINGVLYYLARTTESHVSFLVVCFDVRFEKFEFIDGQNFFSSIDKLINYKGKLGGVFLDYDDDDSGYPCELCVWVLEDVGKQEWSKYVYYFPKTELSGFDFNMSVVGMTATGEIVFSEHFKCTGRPSYVFYFNPERNTLQRVEIEGLGGDGDDRVHTFVDYIEDLNVHDLKQLKSKPQLLGLTSREQRQHTFRQ